MLSEGRRRGEAAELSLARVTRPMAVAQRDPNRPTNAAFSFGRDQLERSAGSWNANVASLPTTRASSDSNGVYHTLNGILQHARSGIAVPESSNRSGDETAYASVPIAKSSGAVRTTSTWPRRSACVLA